MADLSQTVEIIFEGVNRLGAGVDAVVGQVNGISNSISSATAPMASFTGDMLKFEAGLLAAGVAATGLAVFRGCENRDGQWGGEVCTNHCGYGTAIGFIKISYAASIVWSPIRPNTLVRVFFGTSSGSKLFVICNFLYFS